MFNVVSKTRLMFELKLKKKNYFISYSNVSGAIKRPNVPLSVAPITKIKQKQS